MKKIQGKVVGYKGRQEIEINDQGVIESITAQGEEEREEEGWISLGGVDLQINGALGLAFPDVEEKDIGKMQDICYYLKKEGVDSYLPTIVTTSVEKIHTALRVIKQVMAWQKNTPNSGAEILGVHLEGPFLNREKRGAHPEEYLLKPTLEVVKEVLGDYGDIVKVMTLAPEIDLKQEVIPYLRALDIIVSLGHSQATLEQAKGAFKQGATMVTHAYNAMPLLHHRSPGLLAEAMLDPSVYCGLIVDGQHVSPSMIDLLLRVSKYEQGVFLVSDALSPIGLPEGIYPWDNRQIEVKAGTARLSDGTLAGTTVPLLQGIENLVAWGICDLETAISLATEAPRRALGMPLLQKGTHYKDLLYWHHTGEKITWQRISDTL